MTPLRKKSWEAFSKRRRRSFSRNTPHTPQSNPSISISPILHIFLCIWFRLQISNSSKYFTVEPRRASNLGQQPSKLDRHSFSVSRKQEKTRSFEFLLDWTSRSKSGQMVAGLTLSEFRSLLPSKDRFTGLIKLSIGGMLPNTSFVAPWIGEICTGCPANLSTF